MTRKGLAILLDCILPRFQTEAIACHLEDDNGVEMLVPELSAHYTLPIDGYTYLINARFFNLFGWAIRPKYFGTVRDYIFPVKGVQYPYKDGREYIVLDGDIDEQLVTMQAVDSGTIKKISFKEWFLEMKLPTDDAII